MEEQKKRDKRPGSRGNTRAAKEGPKRLAVDISLSDTKTHRRRAVYQDLARRALGREPTDEEVAAIARQDIYAYIDMVFRAEQ